MPGYLGEGLLGSQFPRSCIEARDFYLQLVQERLGHTTVAMTLDCTITG
jgi:hypothetical protein